MSLCQPIILGPISELSSSIHVQGQLSGALIKVLSLPGLKKIAEGTAALGDQYVNLLPGVQLSANDLLVAVQEFGGEVSDLPVIDLAMGVQQGPQNANDIGVVGFETHLYECGEFVWINGVIPGANVKVLANGIIIGSGQALEGFARLALTKGLPPHSIIQTHQVAKLPSRIVVAGPDILKTPDPLPVPPRSKLPSPLINPPLRKCDRAVLISSVIDGAIVTIHNSSGAPDEFAGFDLNSSWFMLQQELKEGDEITVKQDLSKCKLFGVWSEPSKVGPLGNIDPPLIKQPLCIGMQRITLQNLRPGANISIFANGDVYRGTAPLNSTEHTFGIPALSSNTVTAIQEVCGISSLRSEATPVENHQEHIRPVFLMNPLFACGQNVSVKNVHPGAVLQVFARKNNVNTPISGQVSIFETQAVISVAPFLHAGDEVTVAQWACAEKRTDSNVEIVKVHGFLQSPHILDALRSGDSDVQLWDIVPGALVELYVKRNNGPLYFAGSAVGNALFKSMIIYSSFPLQTGDKVSARQLLCDQIPDFTIPVTVGELPGFGPRPFYVVDHNPNTIKKVKKALDEGANALGPDINVYEDDSSQLCISHGEGESDTISLQQYLTGLHNLVIKNKQLALIVFDCKEKAATPEHGLTILTAIRNFLTFDTGVNIILSVGKFGSTDIFKYIKHILGPREGLMIDEENDPVAVSNFFLQAGVTNHAFGNGISIASMPTVAPNVRPSIERACAFRATIDHLKFIFVWTLNDESLKRLFINIGVDGIITDDVPELIRNVKEPQFQNILRIANLIDNPMHPANFSYGLAIHTSDRSKAGTDANITITLTGTSGTGQKTVDAKLRFRMERNLWNFVTLHSPDLGNLLSITVQRDNQGDAPDWYLDKIVVQSFRYGVLKTATFNRDIDSTSPFTEPLV